MGTSKQYPFVGRIWELKTINSIDYTDSSATNIQLYIKSNSVVKILPGYSKQNLENNWISDKIRFSFDGMFSPERILTCTISSGKNTVNSNQNWLDIFNNVLHILYFQNHLLKHELKQLKLVFVFNENLDIESLVMLMLLSKKYSFIELRKISMKKNQEDFESNFLINSIKNLGSNLSILKEIVEGNHILCQDIVESIKPSFITSSEILNRKDSTSFFSLIDKLGTITNLKSKNWNGFNMLTTHLNEVGSNSLNNFKSFSISDFSTSSGIVFIDNNFSDLNLKKIIELKLLNYFNTEIKNKAIIEIHNIFKNDFLIKTKKNYNSSVYFSLPNK